MHPLRTLTVLLTAVAGLAALPAAALAQVTAPNPGGDPAAGAAPAVSVVHVGMPDWQIALVALGAAAVAAVVTAALVRTVLGRRLRLAGG